MFLRQIAAVFLDRTRPDSSMAKPAAMNITRTPWIRKENELRTNAVSGSTAASALPIAMTPIAARVMAMAVGLMKFFTVMLP